MCSFQSLLRKKYQKMFLNPSKQLPLNNFKSARQSSSFLPLDQVNSDDDGSFKGDHSDTIFDGQKLTQGKIPFKKKKTGAQKKKDV